MLWSTAPLMLWHQEILAEQRPCTPEGLVFSSAESEQQIEHSTCNECYFDSVLLSVSAATQMTLHLGFASDTHTTVTVTYLDKDATDQAHLRVGRRLGIRNGQDVVG